MPEQRKKRRTSWGFVIVAITAVVTLTILLGVTFDWLRNVGTVLFAVFVAIVILYIAFGDATDAMENERYVEENPEHVYSEDIGRTVTAIADFSPGSSSSTGKVSLGGETWDAVYEGHPPPSKGDKLVIAQRDGLKFIVKDHESD